MSAKPQPTMADEVIGLVHLEDGFVSDYLELAQRALERAERDRALDLCSQALSLCQNPDIDLQRCRGLVNLFLGAVHHSQGNVDKADHAYCQALNHFGLGDSPSDRWHVAVAHYGRGLVALSRKDWGEALRWLREGRHQAGRVATDIPDSQLRLERMKSRIIQVQELKEHHARGNADIHGIPVVGYTSAGEPILAIAVDPYDRVHDRLSLHGRQWVLRPLSDGPAVPRLDFDRVSKYFALYVDGESMIDAGIHPGDYVIFRKQSDVDSGQVAVVRVDNPDGSSSTVKRLIKRSGKLVLKAENPAFIPLEQIYTASDPTVEVLGMAVAVASQ